MPIFEFQCRLCNHKLEELLRSSEPLPVQCPKCGELALEKLLSHVSFQLKGGGWYTDGYGKQKPAEAPKSEAPVPAAVSDTSKKESAPAATPGAQAPSPPSTPASKPDSTNTAAAAPLKS